MGQVGRPSHDSSCNHDHNSMSTAANAIYHFECPTCGYVSPKTASRKAIDEFSGYHAHPVVQVAKYDFWDGHSHVYRTTPDGRVSEQRPDEPTPRPTEMSFRDIVKTHAISANPDPNRFAARKLGAPQVASILERHYQNAIRIRQNQDLVQKYSSGDAKPSIDVRWNDGNPVVTGGLTTLAIARKHFPDMPIGLNYID